MNFHGFCNEKVHEFPMVLSDFKKMHVFKNVVFSRNHQIPPHRVTFFALETLYRWSFSDAENGLLYSVCDVKNITRYNGF